MRVLPLLFVLAAAGSALADAPRRALGAFRLGMTVAEFRLAAETSGLSSPRLSLPEDHDLMGLGVMEVQRVVAESPARSPEGEAIWRATGYLVSDRVAFLEVDYGRESPERRERWFERLDAPANARKSLQDATWHDKRWVWHVDRYGQRLSVVDWQGLHQSLRIMVSVDGAVSVANEYFRRELAREAVASLEYLRDRVAAHFEAQHGGDDECAPVESTDYTPAETACGLPDHRFPRNAEPFRTGPWATLDVDPSRLSRYFSYMIESSGRGLSSRVMLVAVGDLDCDDVVGTVRVALRSDARAPEGTCRLDAGEWEHFDPYE